MGANSPVLFGNNFNATPEIAPINLLFSGFFKAGVAAIIPANLNYLNYLYRIILSRLPNRCPIKKTGVLGYILNTLLIKVRASFNSSL